MIARRVLEEVLVPATIVAPLPATVTQRTCLEHFGIAPADFLRFAADGAFAVTERGKLRVARYADVEAYLTEGARVRAKRVSHARKEPEPPPVDPVDALDAATVLRKLGLHAPSPRRRRYR